MIAEKDYPTAASLRELQRSTFCEKVQRPSTEVFNQAFKINSWEFSYRKEKLFNIDSFTCELEEVIRMNTGLHREYQLGRLLDG